MGDDLDIDTPSASSTKQLASSDGRGPPCHDCWAGAKKRTGVAQGHSVNLWRRYFSTTSSDQTSAAGDGGTGGSVPTRRSASAMR